MRCAPLVSCIMPTRNRRRFVSQAIWYFLLQDYPARELVVVDDGEDAVSDLIPQDERIRYVRLERQVALGAKRNIACREARGELIAHWDDDDWMARNRLSAQAAQLMAAGAEACGLRELLHYRIETGEVWLYQPPPGERAWVAGGTLLYRRSAWESHPFPEVDVGEDNAFLRRIPPARLHTVSDPSLYVALIHRENTCPKNLADPCWQKRSLDEVSQLLALDRDFYVALRTGRAQSLSLARRTAGCSITVAAQFSVASGYGSMAEYLVRGLARLGASVNVVPLSLDAEGLSEEFNEILRRSQPEPGAPALYFSWPQPHLERFRDASDLFMNTMWESGRLPAGWAEQLNRARAVIVPTRFVARVCRESGVTVPVEVVPEGVDVDVYHYEERPERPGLTTLTIGPIDDRKHVRRGIAAWKQAFGNDPEAHLIIKSQYNYQNYMPDDSRIRYLDLVEHTRGIAHWYRQADVLLALGNEGFGLPLVEAMATGLPVIALSSEGQADVCEEAGDFVLPVAPATWESYDNNVFGRCGTRGVPSVEDVAAKLRWVDRHRAEAREMGRAASAWVLRHRDVWAKAPAVLEMMERRVQPERPLRRRRTLWVPTWDSACGVAEYTRHLTASLTGVEVTTTATDIRRLRLLHVQHQHGLYDEAELAQHVQRARQHRVPVVVTEHLVRPQISAWERGADALVTMTERGAATLRQRWPAKRVELIPHGCPTFFPPRKRTQGRVLGGFGFMQEHKGFMKLVQVLRAVQGTELLLFSHPRSAKAEAQWREAVQGMPVRRVTEFLPIDHIAQRLAAEADVLVFWYDDVGHPTASYAVRVGLSTGVPVLTSPTGWFGDLRAVTHQTDDIGEGVRHLLEDTNRREALTAAARQYCHEHSWPRIAERHVTLWRELESA